MFKISFFSSSDFTLPILKSILHSKNKTLGQVALEQYDQIKDKLVLQPHKFTPSLFKKEILQEKVHLEVVITQPDRVNRGKTFKNPISQFCSDKKIQTYQPNKINEDVDTFRDKHGDLDISIVASFGQILNTEVLEVPKYGMINWHPSLLPKYRGASPMQSAIKNGDEQTGLTWIQMGSGMDDGNIWVQIQKPLKGENINSLSDKMGTLGSNTWAIVAAMKVLEQNDLLSHGSTRQKPENATFCKMIDKKDAVIKPKLLTSKEVKNHFLAHLAYPGTKFSCNYFGQQVKIMKTGKEYSTESFNKLLQNSDIISKNTADSLWIQVKEGKNKNSYIQCNDSYLEVQEIMLKNGKTIKLQGFTF